MARKLSLLVCRKPRTDAQRNRESILKAAKEAFTRFGAGASLDEIAKQAGVGAGTLYRHFPTRDALIEAVYRSELKKLAAAEHKFAETMPPKSRRGSQAYLKANAERKENLVPIRQAAGGKN
jgi:AcrR family transcriptional regulator